MEELLEGGIEIKVKNAEGDPDTTATIIHQNSIDYEPKVSVIIPVYNTEEYLRECLDSVVNQTLKEIEIICVDDGSTDSSLEILTEYAQKDSRFTIITQKNLHAGVARNAGLAVATGKYVHIFDADDYIDINIYKDLYNKVKKADIDLCIFDVNFYDIKNKTIYKENYTLKKEMIPNKEVFSKLDIPDSIFTMTPSWAWNKFIRREFLKNHKIYFQNTMHSNDVYFAYITLALSKKIVVDFKPYIYHRENVPTGLTSKNIRQKYPLVMLDVIDKIDKRLKKEGLYNILERAFIHGSLSILKYNLTRLKDESYIELDEKIRNLILKKYCLQKKENEFYFYPHIKNFVNSYLSKNEKYENRKEKSLCDLIKQYDIISFDLFDTLILRPYISPRDVFKHIEQYKNREGFYDARIKAEEIARKTFNKECVTYDEIYSAIPDFADLKEIEKKLEISTIYCNLRTKKYYDYALKLGKKVIFTTDMYFSKDVLSEILKKNGLNNYQSIFISSEINKSKHNGDLFDYISIALNEKKSSFLHIGDNIHSDIKMAELKGIKTYYLKKPMDELCDKNIQYKVFKESNKDNLTASIILGLLLKKYTINPDFDKNYWTYLGYVFGGPLCYAVTKFLLNKVNEFNIEDLIFVARDGYTIKNIFELFCSSIKTHYIIAPRTINMIINQDYKDHLTWTDRTNSFINILPYYCKNLKNKCKKLRDKNDKLNFINDNKTLIEKASIQAYENYMQYMKRFQINSNRIALFDVASSGFSSLKLLQKTIKKNILGLFFQSASNPQKGIDFLTYKNNLTDGYLHVYELLEFLITAPEYPVLYINNKSNFVKLKTLNEYKRINNYKKIMNSEIDFAKDLKETFSENIPDFDCKTIISLINSFSDNLTRKDIKNFDKVKFLSSEDHKRAKRIIEKKGEEFIPVVFASDNNYMPYTYIAIKSMLKNKSKNTKYKVVILHPDDIDKKHTFNLTTLVKNYKCNIEFINMKQEFKNIKMQIEHISMATYYRLLLPNLLKSYDKCIWLDGDLIVKEDLQKFYNIDLKDNYLAGVRAPYAAINKNYNKVLQIPSMNQYINAGVTLWNLKKMREDNLVEQFKKILPNNYLMQDQDIMNIVCYNKIKLLPLKYNVMTKVLNLEKLMIENNIFNHEDFKNAKKQPVIIHYAAPEKPWNANVIYLNDWWEYAKYSPYYKNSFQQNIFSIKNEPIRQQHKIITILGLKLKIRKKDYGVNSFVENIFSVKNEHIRKQHKIITILGLKLKIKRKEYGDYSFIERIFSVKNKESRDSKWYKVICILGVKFSFKNKELTQRKQLQNIEQRISQLNNLQEQQINQINNKLNSTIQNFDKQIKEANSNINNTAQTLKVLIEKINTDIESSVQGINHSIEQTNANIKDSIHVIENSLNTTNAIIDNSVQALNESITNSKFNTANLIKEIENKIIQSNENIQETIAKTENLIVELDTKTNDSFKNIEEKINDKFIDLIKMVEIQRAENAINANMTAQLKDNNQKLQELFEEQKNRIFKLQTELGYISEWQQNFYKANPLKYPIRLSEIEKTTIQSYIDNSKMYLEFGSGGTTFIAINSPKTKVVSVESDPNWINYLMSYNAISNAIEKQKLDIKYINIGKTKEWGYPINDELKENYPKYSNEIFNHIKKEEIDLVLIDGRFRVACALATIMNCSKNTKIMIHDYTFREYYHVLEEFLEIIETKDTLVIFEIKNNVDMKKVQKLYEEYKFIKE